jgi:hypothetical protein
MSRSVFTTRDRQTAEAISGIVYCNPFLAERVELERRALGAEFTPFFLVWHPRPDIEDDNPNVVRIAERVAALANRLRDRLGSAAALSDAERKLYQDVCFYALYYRYQRRFFDMVERPAAERGRHAPFFAEFRSEFRRLLGAPAVRMEAMRNHGCSA